MKKENILFSIVGVLLGFIVGFMFANTTNQRGYAVAQGVVAGQPPSQPAAGGLPPNHPPVENAGPSAAAVEAASKLAAERPEDFEAQVRAAEHLYAAHRYEEAIKLFTRANQLRPEDFEVLVGLGNTSFDAERFVEAEAWYAAALKQQPDNVNIRTDLGLTFFFREPRDTERAVKEFRASLARDPAHVPTLQNLTVALITKGDAAEARTTLSKLAAVSPQNAALPRLRSDLDKLGAPGRAAAGPAAVAAAADEGGK